MQSAVRELRESQSDGSMVGAGDFNYFTDESSADRYEFVPAVRNILLKLLASDLIDGSGQWKPQKEIGKRFWNFIELKEVLNIWVALTPSGISEETCKSAFTVLDYSIDYNPTGDLVKYEAQRSTGDGVTLLPRSDVFVAYGVHSRAKHSWWTMEDMKYGYAYIWRSTQSPHGAMLFTSKKSEGSRVSMDSRVVFLKVKPELFGKRE